MVAMAVAPGRRDECREMVDQLQRGERQRRGAIALGLGQPVDDMVGVEQIQTLKREGRACAVAQQPLLVPKRGRSSWTMSATCSPGRRAASRWMPRCAATLLPRANLDAQSGLDFLSDWDFLSVIQVFGAMV
jgi:hypothetical protein